MKILFSNAKNTLKIPKHDENSEKNKNINIIHHDFDFPVVESNLLGFRYKVLSI